MNSSTSNYFMRHTNMLLRLLLLMAGLSSSLLLAEDPKSEGKEQKTPYQQIRDSVVAPKDSNPKPTPEPEKYTTDVVLTDKNSLRLNDYVEEDTVASLIKRARELDSSLPSKDPLYLVINSGGGSIQDGINLYENLQHLNRPVKTVTIFSASMAFHTVQELGERLLLHNGTLMSHRAAGAFGGYFPGNLETREALWLNRVQDLDDHVISRTGGKYDRKSYADLVRDEFWCDGARCAPFMDRVVTASCDSSLAGEEGKVVDRFAFLGAIIEIYAYFNKCPLATGMLRYSVVINGKPLFRSDDQLKQILEVDPKTKAAVSTDPQSQVDWYYYHKQQQEDASNQAVSLDASTQFKLMQEVHTRTSRFANPQPWLDLIHGPHNRE